MMKKEEIELDIKKIANIILKNGYTLHGIILSVKDTSFDFVDQYKERFRIDNDEVTLIKKLNQPEQRLILLKEAVDRGDYE